MSTKSNIVQALNNCGENVWTLTREHCNEPSPFVCSNGHTYWHDNGIITRKDGPAVEHTDGFKMYLVDGKFHRVEGPALLNNSGAKLWYFQDEYIDCTSQEQFETILKSRLIIEYFSG